MSLEQIVCEFCKHEFTNKSTLTLHQKTAKYCLKLQGRENDSYKCQFCETILTSNQRLLSHEACCKSRQENENEVKLQKLNDDMKAQKQQFEKDLLEQSQRFGREMHRLLQEKDEMRTEFKKALSDKQKLIDKLYGELVQILVQNKNNK